MNLETHIHLILSVKLAKQKVQKTFLHLQKCLKDKITAPDLLNTHLKAVCTVISEDDEMPFARDMLSACKGRSNAPFLGAKTERFQKLVFNLSKSPISSTSDQACLLQLPWKQRLTLFHTAEVSTGGFSLDENQTSDTDAEKTKVQAKKKVWSRLMTLITETGCSNLCELKLRIRRV